MRLPDFVIIGAMKCGTSTLHTQLAARRGVFMSEPKEPNFFSDDDRWANGIAGYAALFEGAGRDEICGESSTHYTKLPTYPRTVERIARHLPDARFVYVVRDPLDRIVSQSIHEWTQREVREPFAAAVERHSRFVAYSSYAMQLAPYLEHWGRSRLLLVAFERMIARPDDELARICAFLGDPSPSRRLGAATSSDNMCRAAHAQERAARHAQRAAGRPDDQGSDADRSQGAREIDLADASAPAALRRAAGPAHGRARPRPREARALTGRPISVATWADAVADAPLEWCER